MLISGKVQGVSFRFYAHEKAVQLGLHGWVQNMSDGRVELVISGSDEAVSQMIDWAKQGPPLAHVMQVEMAEFNESVKKESFLIKRDGSKGS